MTEYMLEHDDLRAVRNPLVAAPQEPYGAQRAQILDAAGFAAAEREIVHWPGYAVTPLHGLPALARNLGLGALLYKDEGARFGLKSFKALGGAYAVYRLLVQEIRKHNGGQPVDASELFSGRWKVQLANVTVIA